MYELVILGLLMRWPMHGYLMAGVIGDIIGPFAKMSHGRLYPLLTRLEVAGCIARAPAPSGRPGGAADARRAQTYTITTAGRARFRQLMADTGLSQGDYGRIFWIKVAFFDLTAPDERRRLVDHYAAYCEVHLRHLAAEIDDVEGRLAGEGAMNRPQREAILFTLRHGVAQWRLDLEHLDLWRRTQGDQEPPGDGVPAGPAPPRPVGR